jgi:hypothetical protein
MLWGILFLVFGGSTAKADTAPTSPITVLVNGVVRFVCNLFGNAEESSNLFSDAEESSNLFSNAEESSNLHGNAEESSNLLSNAEESSNCITTTPRK